MLTQQKVLISFLRTPFHTREPTPCPFHNSLATNRLTPSGKGPLRSPWKGGLICPLLSLLFMATRCQYGERLGTVWLTTLAPAAGSAPAHSPSLGVSWCLTLGTNDTSLAVHIPMLSSSATARPNITTVHGRLGPEEFQNRS